MCYNCKDTCTRASHEAKLQYFNRNSSSQFLVVQAIFTRFDAKNLRPGSSLPPSGDFTVVPPSSITCSIGVAHFVWLPQGHRATGHRVVHLKIKIKFVTYLGTL